MELQASGDAPSLRWREGPIQRRRPIRVQSFQNHSDHRYLWVGLVYQPAHLMSEVLHGTPLGDRHVAPARLGFTSEEQVAGAAAHVLVVLAPGTSRGRWQGRTGIGQQLGGTLVETDHRPGWVIGFGVQSLPRTGYGVQHVLHVGHEVGAHLGNAPLLLPSRLEFVFSGAAAPSRGTRTPPIPVPPSSPPVAAGSSGRGLRAL